MNKQHTPYQSSRERQRALREADAAYYIGMSRSFLRQSRMSGHTRKRDSDRGNSDDDEDDDSFESRPLESRTPGPPFIKIGNRSIRYLIEDLDAWLEQFREETAA